MAAKRTGWALAAAVIFAVSERSARAEIYRWDDGTLIPGTEGIWPVPNARLDVGNLQFADLRQADLTSALAYSADLAFADLTSARLFGAQVSGANLTGATLNSAYLRRTNFNTADMSGADLTGAILRGAILTHVRNFTPGQLYATASYQQRQLQGTSFSYLDLAGWDLSGQDLTKTSFQSANLTSALFTGAILRSTNFYGVTGFSLDQLYSSASYQCRDLGGTKLETLNLANGDFSGQNLASASFRLSTLTSANFSFANLAHATLPAEVSGANFTGAIIRGANFPGSSAQLYTTASYQARDLAGVRIGGNDPAGWNFAGQDLTSCLLSGSAFSGADFTDAWIQGAEFRASSTNPTLSLSAAQLYSTASYKGGNLRGISIGNAAGWNFTGQDLSSAKFSGSLASANFSDATIRGATFYAGNLSAQQLYSTRSYKQRDLAGIRLLQADGWNFAGQNLASADLWAASLVSANLTGADLSFADLSGADLTQADLTGATIQGANLKDAEGFTQWQLIFTASYQARDLRGIKLGTFNYSSSFGWSFAWQNMSGADLSWANFRRADFSAADLTGVDFTYTDLTSAWFDDANLVLADLRGTVSFAPGVSTHFRGTIMPDGTVQPFELRGGETFQVRGLWFFEPAYLIGPVTMQPGSSAVFGGKTYTQHPLVVPPQGSVEVEGTLDAGGATALILDGGVLRGRGSILGKVVAGSTAHTIAPAQASVTTGTLTMQSLTTNGLTTLEFVLADPLSASPLHVTDAGGLILDGGTIAVIPTLTDATSLGYFSIIQYHGAVGGAGVVSLQLPVAGDVAYAFDLEHDPGFIDLHRGFQGDANDDGTVTFGDFVQLANHYGEIGGGWGAADFNNDGVTDFTDFTLLAGNFGRSFESGEMVVSGGEVASFEAAAGRFFGPVPEPAGVMLLGLGTALLMGRRGGRERVWRGHRRRP